MSGDGNRLIFGGTDATTGDPILYMVNADGTGLTQLNLPDLGGRGIGWVTIDEDGSRGFFQAGIGAHNHQLYKVQDSTVTKIFDVADYPEIDRCDHPQTTADGEYVYFVDTDDLWRIRHNGGAPEKVIEDTEVPRVDSNGENAWKVGDFAISADASTIVFRSQGFVDPTNYYGISSKEELFVLDGSGYRQLTNDIGNVYKTHMGISGDGTTIVFASGGKWYSIRSDGSAKTVLETYGANFGGLDMTYDGTKMFYADSDANGGRLTNTDGSGRLDVFPGWNVAAITLAVTGSASISNDGRRVAFVFQYSSWPFKEALYVGYLNDTDAVSDAPTIHNIAFDPTSMPKDPNARIILTSQISDPQGLADIERTSTDALLDGVLESGNANLPVYFYYDVHDDGSPPDQTADDGVFSTEGQPGGKIDELDRMTVRIGAMDASKTVVVADTILPIGEITPAPTSAPSVTPPEFSGLIFESRSKSSGSTVQIPLTLKGVTDKIGNMDITLSYDPSVLEATEVIKGGLTTTSLFEYNLIDWGTIKISLADKAGFSGDGSIAYVKFNVIGYEGSVSPLEIVSLSANRAADLAAMDIPTQDGLFTVLSVEECRGDCNGDGKITAADALCALQMAVGKRAEDLVMDVSEDGKVSSIDARKILRVAAGLEML
ncbi:MAG: Cellulosome anchoring protein, cohesin region domain protein [Candidatus Syntrophoarchaeum caldarius]|uniref:Cellulosome anchoring protein, cohesin region domain protein n=1 Tax=Candidatus Syntropharchaeum caldarium TaxID=1838285 RepID=A0A1F2PBF9_9EURY|nr:MAG: Cellulosome anchoring protein, cohesin region domain protein [Candidatus Syntrophoarchaeum caldarius]